MASKHDKQRSELATILCERGFDSERGGQPIGQETKHELSNNSWYSDNKTVMLRVCVPVQCSLFFHPAVVQSLFMGCHAIYCLKMFLSL